MELNCDVTLIEMASDKKAKRSQPLVSYQFTENVDEPESLNKAFDILFEETLKNCSDFDLTLPNN